MGPWRPPSRPDRGVFQHEGSDLSEMLDINKRHTVGVWDIPLVLLAPRRVFGRVEDVTAWIWPLLIQLTVVTLIGYATVQTGLIDREVERRVRARIAQIESVQRDVVERSELRKMYTREYQTGKFEQLLARIQVIVAEPAQALASALLVAAVLYGIVALTGRKTEWNTLLTICCLCRIHRCVPSAVQAGLDAEVWNIGGRYISGAISPAHDRDRGCGSDGTGGDVGITNRPGSVSHLVLAGGDFGTLDHRATTRLESLVGLCTVLANCHRRTLCSNCGERRQCCQSRSRIGVWVTK